VSRGAAPEDDRMSVAHVPRGGAQQGSWEDFLAVLSGRAVWKLLVKGLGVFLPDYHVSTGSVLVADGSSVTGAPVFRNGDAGFGLHLRERKPVLEPDREIYVRGREVRSIGIVATGSVAALGTRVVDAEGLLRYGRGLTFQTLFDATEARSAIAAIRAAKAVENVVFLDPAAGLGLCGEVDPISRVPACPLYVRIGDRASRAVQVYTSGGWAAQAVRSRT
jgi:hypothetical protein